MDKEDKLLRPVRIVLELHEFFPDLLHGNFKPLLFLLIIGRKHLIPSVRQLSHCVVLIHLFYQQVKVCEAFLFFGEVCFQLFYLTFIPDF